MRVILNLTPSQEVVPFTYKERCASFLHDALPLGNLHGGPSLYCFSNILGDSRYSKEDGGLWFPYGAQIYFNFHSKELAKLFVKGVGRSPYFGFGMRVEKIILQQSPVFEYDPEGVTFKVISPVLAKSKRTGVKQSEFLFAGDRRADAVLTRILNDKAKLAGIDHIGRVFFDPTYTRTTTKAITYKGTVNKTSVCPVVVQGHPEILKFAWNVGVGNSTGIGFGALL